MTTTAPPTSTADQQPMSDDLLRCREAIRQFQDLVRRIKHERYLMVPCTIDDILDGDRVEHSCGCVHYERRQGAQLHFRQYHKCRAAFYTGLTRRAQVNTQGMALMVRHSTLCSQCKHVFKPCAEGSWDADTYLCPVHNVLEPSHAQ